MENAPDPQTPDGGDADLSDRVVLQLLERLAVDAAELGVRPLDEYLARYPDHRATVEREYAAFVGGEASAEPPPATRPFGPYRLEVLLGRGGQGSVHRAVDTRLDRTVALKQLPGLADGEGDRPPAILARELEALTRLDHPGIAGVLEAGSHDGIAFIATRFVPGVTLAERLVDWREAPPSIPERLEVVAQIAEALGVAHAAGVVHRDVKPANVVFDAEDRPVLIDFGLARTVDSELPSLTVTGDVIGTPRYLSPERLRGEGSDDPRGDVWALGVLLYELVALEPPFDGPTVESIARGIERDEPRALRRAATTTRGSLGVVGRDLDAVVAVALEKRVDRRYSDARSLAADLRRLLRGEPIEARPPGSAGRVARWVSRNPAPSAVLLLLVVLAVGAGLAAWKLDRVADAERDARRAAEAGVARADAERARLILGGEAPGRFVAALERLTAVGAVLARLDAAPTPVAQLESIDRLAVRNDAVRAMTALDLIDLPAAPLGGLGVVKVDPGGSVAIAMLVSAATGDLALRAHRVEGGPPLAAPLDGVTLASTLFAVGPGGAPSAFVDGGRLRVQGGGAPSLEVDLSPVGLGPDQLTASFDAAFGADGDLLAVACSDVWCLVEPSTSTVLAHGTWDSGVRPFARFAPGGDVAVFPGDGSSVQVVDVARARADGQGAVTEVDLELGTVHMAAVLGGSGGGCRVAGVVDDAGSLAVVERRDGRPPRSIAALPGGLLPIPALAFDPDARWLAAAGGGRLRVVDLESSTVAYECVVEESGGFEAFQFVRRGPDLELLHARRGSRLVRLALARRIALEEPLDEVPPTDEGERLLFLSREPRAADESFDPSGQLRGPSLYFEGDPPLELATGRPGMLLRVLGQDGQEWIRGPVALDANPPRAAARSFVIGASGLAGVVSVWERGRAEPLFAVDVDPLNEGGSLALSADGRRLAVAEPHGATRLFDVDSGAELVAFDLSPPALSELRFERSGDLVGTDASGRARRIGLAALEAELERLGLGW